jgi:hypothetical protein
VELSALVSRGSTGVSGAFNALNRLTIGRKDYMDLQFEK